MDTSIAAVLISIFGAGAFGGIGFIFTGLRTGIRDNGKRIGRLEEGFSRLEERFGGLEGRVGGLEECVISEFGQVKDVLARIETTQVEHGRQIEKLSGDQP